MSIIQQHTSASLSENWRTINIDALDPESSVNFDVSTLVPALPDVSEAEVRSIASQVRQLLRGGDSEGALRGALESAPVGAREEAVKVRLRIQYVGLGRTNIDDYRTSTYTPSPRSSNPSKPPT
jgi:actin related protein 2/3 complex subunit 5